MATVGGGAAYQRLTVPEDDLSVNARHQAGIAAGHVRQLRGINEGKRRDKEEKVKEWGEKYNLKPEDFKNKYTGFGSYDDIHRDYARYTTDQYVDLNRQAREASEKGDLKEKHRLEAEMIKRKNNFSLVIQGQEALATIKENYMKAVQEGRVSGASKNFEGDLQSGILDFNVAIREDENGNPIYVGLRTDEETGEQTPFEIANSDLIDNSFTWIERQDIKGKEGLVQEVLGGLGTITTKTPEGLMNITEQKWDDNIHGKAADDAIETYISNDRMMSDLLYQFSKGENIKTKDFTEEDYSLVESKFKDQIKAGYSTKYEEDFDSGRAANQRGWAALNKKGAKENNEGMIDAEPMTSSDDELLGGLPYPSTDTELGVQDGGRYTLKTKGGKPIKGILAGDSESEVLSITKSGDQYLVDTRRTDMVTTKDRRTGESMKVPRTASNQLVLSDEELNRLARRMGLKTAGEMDSYLEQRTRDYNQAQQQSAADTKAKAAELIAKYKK